MPHARVILAFAVAAIVGAFVGCGTNRPGCSPASCTGCCDEAGACKAGASQSACGNQGGACAPCQAGNVCEYGTCRAVSAMGGDGGALGGGGGAAVGGGAGGGAVGGGGGNTDGGTGGGSTDGGGGDGGSPRFDAGTVTRPDGGVLNPPTVTLTFMNDCGTVTSCPGNEVDAWAYSAGCIDESIFTRIASAGQGVGCTGTVSNKRGAVAGSVVFDGTRVRRSVVGEVDFHLSLAGANCANPNFCPIIPDYFPAGVRGTCALVGALCECDLTFGIGQNSAQNYTSVGGLLTVQSLDGGADETYESCITGSTLTYRETTNGAIPGVFSLTK